MSGVGFAGEVTPLKDQKAKDSYSLGYEFGDNLRRMPLQMDTDILIAGVLDALKGEKAAMTADEIRKTLLDLRKRVVILQDRRIREQAAVNLEKEKVFLEENGKKKGVVKLPEDIQYKVLRQGTGPHPEKDDLVRVNFRGTLLNGAEFDSSYGRGEPVIMPVSGGIRGLDEVLQLMRIGSKWQIFIPSRAAFGKRSYNRIPPNSTLIYELELLSIEKKDDAELKKINAEGYPHLTTTETRGGGGSSEP
jgi:FKBP-type peptidyl-prolyl cis-trans isomerase FklB